MHHQFFQYPPCSSPLFSLFTSVPIPIKSTSPIPLTIHLSHHRFHHPKPAYPFFSPPFSFYTPHACHLNLHNTHKTFRHLFSLYTTTLHTHGFLINLHHSMPSMHVRTLQDTPLPVLPCIIDPMKPTIHLHFTCPLPNSPLHSIPVYTNSSVSCLYTHAIARFH